MMLTIYKPSNTKHCMMSHTRCIFFGSTFITSPVRNAETPYAVFVNKYKIPFIRKYTESYVAYFRFKLHLRPTILCKKKTVEQAL